MKQPGRRTLALGLAAALLILFALPAGITALAARSLRARAAAHAYGARWLRLRFTWPATLAVEHLRLIRANGDTACAIDSLRVQLDPLSLFRLRPAARSIELAHARIVLKARVAAPDTLAPDSDARTKRASDRSARLRATATQLVRGLLAPARRLPRLSVRDLALTRPGADDEPGTGLRLTWLLLEPASRGVRLSAAGAIETEAEIPFRFGLEYGEDDRLRGGADIGIPDQARGAPDTLRLAFDGRLEQDRAHHRIVLADSSWLQIGQVPLRLFGRIEGAGPHVDLHLEGRDFTAARWKASLPAPLLGPLADLELRGAWDYRAAFDLDLAAPDDVQLEADVIPHGLALDFSRDRLGLGALARPFIAHVHLPHAHVVDRDLSEASPHFRPLDRMDSTLVHAVVTNEDGAFFRHRGFNLEAVRGAIADDIRAGAYARGAGTITMQLVRNLYLGHDRTLSRKAQEVALAWVLEHLTGVDKHRMLEIYLNIVEWGPDALGAEDAMRFYFGHDAAKCSVAEALFLATVLPAPARWLNRFAPDGTLRPFEQAQMHFIGRAMIAKGWLAASDLPAADSLAVELRGPARSTRLGGAVAAALDSLRRLTAGP